MATFDTSMYRQNPLRTVAEYENDLLRNDTLRGGLQRNQLAMEGERQSQSMNRDLHDMKMRAEPDVRATAQAGVRKDNIDNMVKAAKFISFAVAQATGPDQVAEVMNEIVKNPDLAPVFGLMQGGYDGAMQRLRESSGTAQEFAKYQLRTQSGVEALLPKIYNYSAGTHQVTMGVDPQTGKPVFTNAHEIGQSANSEATERVSGVRNEIAATRSAAANPGSSPFFQAVPTTEGLMTFDARSGTFAPANVGGRSLVKPSDDPNTQGRIAEEKEAGKGVGEQRAMLKGKEDALSSVRDAKKMLDDGIYTGTYAKLQTAAAKAIPGVDTTKASRTEEFLAHIGNVVIPRLKEFGGNDSNEELKYLRQVTGGEITLEEQTLKKIVADTEKKIAASIKRLQTRESQGSAPSSGGKFKYLGTE